MRHNLICDNCNWEFLGYAVGEIPDKPTRVSGSVKMRPRKLDAAAATNRLIELGAQYENFDAGSAAINNESEADLATAALFAEDERQTAENENPKDERHTAETETENENSKNDSSDEDAEDEQFAANLSEETFQTSPSNIEAETPNNSADEEAELRKLKIDLPNDNLVSLLSISKRRKKSRRAF